MRNEPVCEIYTILSKEALLKRMIQLKKSTFIGKKKISRIRKRKINAWRTIIKKVVPKNLISLSRTQHKNELIVEISDTINNKGVSKKEFVFDVDKSLVERMLKVKEAFSYRDKIVSLENQAQTRLANPLEPKQTIILEKTIHDFEDYQYKLSPNNFSVSGKNPLKFLAEAQFRGFKPLTYTLKCENEEDVVYILDQNRKDAALYEEKSVEVNEVIIKDQKYSTFDFMDNLLNKIQSKNKIAENNSNANYRPKK